MKDKDKTKNQLINELVEMRQRITELEKSETECKLAEKALWESDQKFRIMAEASPVPFVISRIQDGAILFGNQSLADTFGLSIEEISGQKTLDFYYDPADRQTLLKKLSKDGQLDNYEVLAKKADGSSFWVSTSIKYITFNNERSLLSGFWDITERKQMEEVLQESEQRYRTIYEESRDAIYITTREGKVLDINQSGLNLFGYTREEMIGLDIREIYIDPVPGEHT
jgi:PAS domain S-box-containing protein